MKKHILKFSVLILSALSLIACQGEDQNFSVMDGNLISNEEIDFAQRDDVDEEDHEHYEQFEDDSAEIEDLITLGCSKPSSSQLSPVNQGNKKYDKFVNGCKAATGNSSWCLQLTRPNPSSKSTFKCTYGSDQVHRLIHPDESTWKHAYTAVKLIQELQNKGIKVSEIYNWWRPEPYNKNVGGAAGRHPFGTSVDVRFSSSSDMEKAHKQLCKWRAEGRLRALGYYGSRSLHFGIGDKTGNTWGKSCR